MNAQRALKILNEAYKIEVDMFPHTSNEKIRLICFRELTGRMTSMVSSRAMLRRWFW